MSNQENSQTVNEHNPKLEPEKTSDPGKPVCKTCLISRLAIDAAEAIIKDLATSLKDSEKTITNLNERLEITNESNIRMREQAATASETCARWRHDAVRYSNDCSDLRTQLDNERRRREQETFTLSGEVSELERMLAGTRTAAVFLGIGFGIVAAVLVAISI